MPDLIMSRREFGGAAAASTLVATAPLLAAQESSQPQYIDAHSHIWTRDVESFPLKAGTTVADLAPPSFTAEELLAAARPLGIGRVVLIAHHTYYGYDNSYMTDAARRYPGVFRVVGMVDDRQPRPDQAMRRLLREQVTGFRITPWTGGDQWLSGPGMAAMWRCAADTRQAMCCLLDPKYLESVDRMCQRFPETPVVIDHFARIGVDGMIRDEDLRNLLRLARHKQTHVKVSAFYALGQKQPPYLDLVPMIRRLVEAFGVERLMWASDCPYQVEPPHTYAASLALVRDRLPFLSPADRDWLLRKTAEKVYFF
ncbi:MAG: amidohydrolase [Pirellulaceae bacterium]|nr:amidohydrolase [Pirellulaceae bacterium]